MSPAREKRLLQIAVGIACLVPLVAGLMGVIFGPGWLRDVDQVPRDLDSHFRYLSGIFLGVGIGFFTCVPNIERHGQRFRLLGAFVVLGGLARLVSLASVGTPSPGHIFGLALELGVVPALMLWQTRLADRYRIGSRASPTSAVGK